MTTTWGACKISWSRPAPLSAFKARTLNRPWQFSPLRRDKGDKMAKLPVPFIGPMVCSNCGVHTSGPEYAGGWRAIDADGRLRYYACPDCLPVDTDSVDTWRNFYIAVGQWLFKENHQRPMKRLTFWREVNGVA